jgi:Flp pilus assembly pilin Flp
MSMLKRLMKDEQGLETVEYAIITGLIVAGTIVTIGLIGTWVKAQFDALEAELNPAP